MGRKRFYEEAEPDEVVVQFDVINEQAIIAAGLACDDERPKLVRQVVSSQFHTDKHEKAWAVVVQMVEQGLRWDARTVATLCDADLAAYLTELVSTGTPGRNLEQHLERLRWDDVRMKAAKGPLPRLLASLKDTRAKPQALVTAARDVSACFDGHGETSAMPAPGSTADEQAVEIRLRMAGKASYPCGIPDLDRCADGSARIVPGFAPRRCTWITGVSGSGKSTLAAMIAHGLWKQGRRVLYGAWEPGLGNVLELMACWEADVCREQMKLGLCTEEEVRRHHEAMREIEKGVRLLRNPFRQGRVEEEQGKRGYGRMDTNERRIDVLAQYIERSGCDVFIADLLKRAFARARDPGEEEQALYMVQDMKDQLGIHVVGLHQQNIKGASVSGIRDRRPSTESSLMGSSAWFQTADLVLGVYREYLYRNVEDNVMEVHVLKQRDARWPIALRFEWNPEWGTLGKGTEFDYRPMEGDAEASEGIDSAFRDPGPKRPTGKRHLHSVKDKHDDDPYG